MILAERMQTPFLVETLEGIEHGAANDVLAQNPTDGEQWPIASDMFQRTYEPAPAPTPSHSDNTDDMYMYTDLVMNTDTDNTGTATANGTADSQWEDRSGCLRTRTAPSQLPLSAAVVGAIVPLRGLRTRTMHQPFQASSADSSALASSERESEWSRERDRVRARDRQRERATEREARPMNVRLTSAAGDGDSRLHSGAAGGASVFRAD